MTIETCNRLLAHYEKIIDGSFPSPVGHRDWALVVSQAKINSKKMKLKIERKMRNPKYAHLVAEIKKEVKK